MRDSLANNASLWSMFAAGFLRVKLDVNLSRGVAMNMSGNVVRSLVNLRSMSEKSCSEIVFFSCKNIQNITHRMFAVFYFKKKKRRLEHP